MDHIDDYLATACGNIKLSKAIRAALAIGKETLNRYYNKTDQSDVYRIAMGRRSPFLLYISLKISGSSPPSPQTTLL
jgi:phosphoribosyl-dephospho-CoA transferase